MIDSFEKVPRLECYLFSQFTKFQQYMFSKNYKLYECGARISISFTVAQSEPIWVHLNALDYIIY